MGEVRKVKRYDYSSLIHLDPAALLPMNWQQSQDISLCDEAPC